MTSSSLYLATCSRFLQVAHNVLLNCHINSNIPFNQTDIFLQEILLVLQPIIKQSIITGDKG